MSGLLVADRRAAASYVLHGEGEPQVDASTATWARRCPRMHEAGFVDAGPAKACMRFDRYPLASVTTNFASDGRVTSAVSCNCLEIPYADERVFLERAFDVDDVFASIGGEGFSYGDWGPSCPMTPEIHAISLLGGELDTVGLFSACSASAGDTWFDAVSFGRRELLDPVKNEKPTRELLMLWGNPDDAPLPWGEQERLVDRSWSSPPATPAIIESPRGWLMEAYASPGDSRQRAAADAMESCIDGGATLWSIRRGFLVGGTVTSDEHGVAACHRAFELSPALCRDEFEPCGSTKAFPGVGASADEFWIASDGRFALLWGDEYHVVDSRGRTSISRPTGGIEVIGVEFHRDASALIRLTQRIAAQREVARREGATLLLPDYAWPVALPEPRRATAPAATLAVEDRGDGRGWGNRCFADYKAGRHDDALAACRRALEIAKDPKIRAAVYFSLGKIAEAKDAAGDAAAYYRTSQVLRPTPATARALSELIERRIADVYPDAPGVGDECSGAECE